MGLECNMGWIKDYLKAKYEAGKLEAEELKEKHKKKIDKLKRKKHEE